MTEQETVTCNRCAEGIEDPVCDWCRRKDFDWVSTGCGSKEEFEGSFGDKLMYGHMVLLTGGLVLYTVVGGFAGMMISGGDLSRIPPSLGLAVGFLCVTAFFLVVGAISFFIGDLLYQEEL